MDSKIFKTQIFLTQKDLVWFYAINLPNQNLLNQRLSKLNTLDLCLVVLQKLSAELDDSRIFQCDKCDFAIEEEDALETHKELYHVNPCQMCCINFDNEELLKEHNEVYHKKKIPSKT